MRHEKVTNFDMHLKTAELLLKGVRESLNETGSWFEGKFYEDSIPPEHSDESVIRRLVQIRQECLQLIKKLR